MQIVAIEKNCKRFLNAVVLRWTPSVDLCWLERISTSLVTVRLHLWGSSMICFCVLSHWAWSPHESSHCNLRSWILLVLFFVFHNYQYAWILWFSNSMCHMHVVLHCPLSSLIVYYVLLHFSCHSYILSHFVSFYSVFVVVMVVFRCLSDGCWCWQK